MGRDDWTQALAAGVFEGSADDRRDGFIHFSTADQAPETARRRFAGRTGLVVLAVEAEPLGEALVWEPSRGGDLFPHLYAPLPVTAVSAVTDAPLGDDGVPRLGELRR